MYPSGIVLDKDGKPCRVCTAFKNWTKQEKKKQHDSSTSHTNNNNSKPNSAEATETIGSVISTNSSDSTLPPDCPPDVEQLGRSTWTFLHTMAAYYPEVPSYAQQRSMKTFLSTFSQFYPCDHCAEHLREEMKSKPPRVESRWALGKWLCEMHNIVNESLGKDIFDCNKIDERWKDGPRDGRSKQMKMLSGSGLITWDWKPM
ncbi:24423_t:CDS:2 [Dentiscutata erythropus]|uniref:Sulfhydryl oxidase n=1 Tax=Dentiscutata erythropus TaxID=1348616 RepID=A0A9N8VG02_9GLOM|nr:24423_t:CDS:2 [Dentiscutata erythropus]